MQITKPVGTLALYSKPLNHKHNWAIGSTGETIHTGMGSVWRMVLGYQQVDLPSERVIERPKEEK